jgi:hypothetical protein
VWPPFNSLEVSGDSTLSQNHMISTQRPSSNGRLSSGKLKRQREEGISKHPAADAGG